MSGRLATPAPGLLRSPAQDLTHQPVCRDSLLDLRWIGVAVGEASARDAQTSRTAPSVPAELVGARVEKAEIDPIPIQLRFSLAGGSALTITPSHPAGEDDPPNWELITPDGLALEFGPGLRWQIARADTPVVRA